MQVQLAQSWLALQCQMIPQVTTGVASFAPGLTDGTASEFCWPPGASADASLLAAARLARSRQAPVTSAGAGGVGGDGHEDLIVAAPLTRAGAIIGAVAVQLTAPPGQQTAVVRLLQWGAAWLEMVLAHRAGATAAAPAPLLTSVLGAAWQAPHAEAAAIAVVNALMQALACERVSLGLFDGGRMRIRALSHSADHDPRATLIRRLEAAMIEAVTHGGTVNTGPVNGMDPHPQGARAGDDRAEAQANVCTLPLIHQGAAVGALCLERPGGRPLDPSQVAQCEELAQLLAPLFEARRMAERPILTKVMDDIVTAPVRSLFGATGRRWKMASVLAVLLLTLTALVPGEFRVAAPASLEGRVQRVVVAPFEGYIAAAYARAGESVKAGDLLAELEDKDLNLERQKLSSQHAETLKQYNKALAELNHAQARIHRAQVAQVEARLGLIEAQLARTKLRAPFDGVVIAGDLSQSLGAPVARGEVLFEMAPLNEYRVVLQVDERDIAQLAAGQTGELSLSALPGERIPLVVERVSAVIETEEEQGLFRVETRIAGSESAHVLRPGMQGIGKIAVGQRSYLWMWTRRLIGWLQLRWWAWLP